MNNLPIETEPYDNTCQYCELSTVECTTKYLYCMRGPTWRIVLFGPQRVPYSHSCKHLILHRINRLAR